MGMNVTIGLGVLVSTHFDCPVSGCMFESGRITAGTTRLMSGTAPGVLLRVCLQCRCFVLIKFCLTVGSHVCMISGASDILVVGTVGMNEFM
jgi:hypothetical protein